MQTPEQVRARMDAALEARQKAEVEADERAGEALIIGLKEIADRHPDIAHFDWDWEPVIDKESASEACTIDAFDANGDGDAVQLDDEALDFVTAWWRGAIEAAWPVYSARSVAPFSVVEVRERAAALLGDAIIGTPDVWVVSGGVFGSGDDPAVFASEEMALRYAETLTNASISSSAVCDEALTREMVGEETS